VDSSCFRLIVSVTNSPAMMGIANTVTFTASEISASSSREPLCMRLYSIKDEWKDPSSQPGIAFGLGFCEILVSGRRSRTGVSRAGVFCLASGSGDASTCAEVTMAFTSTFFLYRNSR